MVSRPTRPACLAARPLTGLALLLGWVACVEPRSPGGPTRSSGPDAAPTPLPGPRDASELEQLVDAVIGREMEQQHIPGAAFVFVQRGRVLLLKGYGLANLSTGQAVDPGKTVWRVGSISKVFTADAVMQLAERRQIDLDADVNTYLQRVKVPDGFGQPVRTVHLLTHTAGFDEIRPGTQAPDQDGVLPLAQFLGPRLKRIASPGAVIAYSTYGMTLAGNLVEEVSGQPFETFLRENLWRPLAMTRTCITVPEEWKDDVAVGYEYENGGYAPQPWEWYHTTPASSINSTAADMARWLLMHLGRGRCGDAVVMSAATIDDMLRQHATGHPKIAGFAYGWNENLEPGYARFLDHGGHMAGFSSEALIIPDRDAGFFVVHHGENASLRDQLKWAILERYYRDSTVAPPQRPEGVSAADLSRFAGRYAWNTWCHTCEGRKPGLVFDVAANADGALAVNNRSWLEVEPLLFLRDDGAARLAFGADPSGRITHMFFGGFWVFEKLP